MPSIPQSLLWISLVVLWLFVLVPMLVSKRDAVRRTSDVALATRVLNNSTAARLIKRGKPAAGHRSNPDWQPDEDEHGDDHLDDADEDDADEDDDALPTRVMATVAAHAVYRRDRPGLPRRRRRSTRPRPRCRSARQPLTRIRRMTPTPKSISPSSTTTKAKPSTTRSSTSTSTTPRGFRSPRSRRCRRRRRLTAGFAMTPTKPPP